MIVSKSISLDAEDLIKINMLVNEGEVASISVFIQKATKNYLKELELEGK